MHVTFKSKHTTQSLILCTVTSKGHMFLLTDLRADLLSNQKVVKCSYDIQGIIILVAIPDRTSHYCRLQNSQLEVIEADLPLQQNSRQNQTVGIKLPGEYQIYFSMICDLSTRFLPQQFYLQVLQNSQASIDSKSATVLNSQLLIGNSN